MPPKGRGRGRGGSRGGASVARGGALPAAAPPEIKSEDANLTEHSNSEKEPAVATEAPNVASTIESVPVVPASSSLADIATDATTRPSGSRLDTLKSATPVSRSSSPATRRGSTRGKKPTFNPTFTGRRSKSEREALENAGRERDKARQLEVDAEKSALEKERRLDAQRRRGGGQNNNKAGRGGYSGVSGGPFSLGSVAQDRSRSGRSTFTSGSRATRIKREDDDGGKGGPSSSRSTRVKEEGGVEESSEDDEADYPRRDIDRIEIEISSDEDEVAFPERRARSNVGHATSGLPVRIARKEHQERVIGINTDASSAASAKILQQAEASGAPIKVEPTEGAPRNKGKGKAKDIEITEVRKPYRGVWQESEEPATRIKAEAASDDEAMPDAVPVDISIPLDEEVGALPVASPDLKKKAKIRKQALKEPIMQTQEDRDEWERFLSDRKAMVAELGPEEEPTTDADGNAIMKDSDKADEPKLSVRDNNPYLFQLPPITPDALPAGMKEELAASTQPPANDATKTPATSGKTPVKVEEGVGKGNKDDVKSPRVASGALGKIRLHASGRTSLMWAGTKFDLNPGQTANFFEETSSVTILPNDQRVAPEDAGEGSSFGRVKGKFIMVPDCLAML